MSNQESDKVQSHLGRNVIITGGNSGLGFESAVRFSAMGARVILACRNENKANKACATIREMVPNSNVEFMHLDLSSLSSIERFCVDFKRRFSRLDILMNNAGVMAIPKRMTEDGFEMQFGTNHLGHFALTGRLLECLLETESSRIVTITSLAANSSKIKFGNLDSRKNYNRWIAYGQSKLANMLFGLELQRRLEAVTGSTISVLAHPGFSSTNLQKGIVEGGGKLGGVTEKIIRSVCQTQEQGVLPQLYAATNTDVRGGQYFGPSGFMGMRGGASEQKVPRSGRSIKDARKLWDASLDLTGVSYGRF